MGSEDDQKGLCALLYEADLEVVGCALRLSGCDRHNFRIRVDYGIIFNKLASRCHHYWDCHIFSELRIRDDFYKVSSVQGAVVLGSD
jgi:hypothetical protein